MSALEHDVIYIGKSNFRNNERVFGIKNDDRFQHVYVIGQTGTGKTTLLRNLAIQDIQSGRGLAVVDPHGEFVQSLLAAVPEHRSNDVVYFNPVDTDYPIGFNILELKNPDHKHLVASGLMSIFTKIWANVWSARMEYILNNAVLALLDTPDTTLLGIPRILVDKVYRQKVIDNCKDPVVRSYWINEYEQYQERFRTEAIAPIQNKVGQFLSTHLIRNIVGQPKSSLDIEDIMNNRKILLVNVSKGLIGEDNSNLLGAMLITKIQLAAMERVRLPASQLQDFLLYVDEFQNFVTDSFASVLSEARKYKLGLTISHQYIGQLVLGDSTKVRDAIFGNVGTTIVFRVGATDAEFLETHFAPDLVAQDLVNLPNRNVYVRLLIQGVSSRAFSASTLPPIEVGTDIDHIRNIVQNSRRLYGRPRKEVEDMIIRWSSMGMGSSINNSSYDPPPRRDRFDAPNTSANSPSPTSQAVRPVAPRQSRPKFETDLSNLGIDVSEDSSRSTGLSPAASIQSAPAPLNQLSTPPPDFNKKKRRRKRNNRGGGGNRQMVNRDELRESLRRAMSGNQNNNGHDTGQNDSNDTQPEAASAKTNGEEDYSYEEET